MRPITLAILLVLIVILVFALLWEYLDFKRLDESAKVYEISDPEKREQAYIFYGTFPYRNTVVWRSVFIQSVAATFLIYYFLTVTTSTKIPINMAIIITMIIFLVFYFGANFKNFHFWRVMASKVEKDIDIF